MIARRSVRIAQIVIAGLAVGLAGCTSAKPAVGHLVLQAVGLPSARSAHFSVIGNGVKLADVKAGTSLRLSNGTYEVVASKVSLGGASYLPTKAGGPPGTVTARVRVRSGHTSHLTQAYVRKSAPSPVTQEWQRLGSTTPFPILYALDRLACTDFSFCMAIGGPRAGDLYQSVWNGKTWSPDVDTGLADTEVNSLACPTDRLCVMGTGSPQMAMPTFVDVWEGTGWVSQSPLGAAVYYTASCAGAHFCMAAAQEPGAGAVDVAVRQASGGWVLVASPATSPDWAVDDVECPSTTFCALAFSLGSRNGTPVLQGLVSLWQDGVWRSQESLMTDANWVGCFSTRYCLNFAVQSVATPTPGQPNDVYATWSGSHWTQVIASASSDQSNYLYLGGIATPQCAAEDSCYETGTLGSTSAVSAATDLLGWNGSDWVPVPTVDQGGSTGEVACATGGYCLETGPGGTFANT
jgi:hypothetical protein